MIQIDNVIFSLNIFEKQFCCDLAKCKGECCVSGDSGAPVNEDEMDVMESEYPSWKPYMTPFRRGIPICRGGGLRIDAGLSLVSSVLLKLGGVLKSKNMGYS